MFKGYSFVDEFNEKISRLEIEVEIRAESLISEINKICDQFKEEIKKLKQDYRRFDFENHVVELKLN